MIVHLKYVYWCLGCLSLLKTHYFMVPIFCSSKQITVSLLWYMDMYTYIFVVLGSTYSLFIFAIGMSEEEKKLKAVREKDKGNEVGWYFLFLWSISLLIFEDVAFTSCIKYILGLFVEYTTTICRILFLDYPFYWCVVREFNKKIWMYINEWVCLFKYILCLLTSLAFFAGLSFPWLWGVHFVLHTQSVNFSTCCNLQQSCTCM